ncbi:protein kinase [Trypanosoma theileri]|uniref:Protein kinase n=1 Tax=Trypanosoma theileri TaxID=67003 RepID=A0A1X0NPZ2_9TRYP|nr:protein kinase [Trypanosoma theileri]ORC86578.1 protein kinase [Trypanosoma theileri]
MSVRGPNPAPSRSGYSIALQLLTELPTVPVAVGASVALAATALALYISTGSPRWKGAPGLSKETTKKRNIASKQCSDPSHTTVITTVCTSTKTPWATSKEETTTPSEMGQEVMALFAVDVVDYVNSPCTSPCGCNCRHYQMHHSTSSQQHYSNNVCEHTVVTGRGTLSPTSCGSRSSSLKRTLSEHLSNNSSANTPTVLLSTCPSRHGVGLLTLPEMSSSVHNEIECEVSNNALDWNSLPSMNSVVSAGVPDMTATGSDMLNEYFPDSFGDAGGCSSTQMPLNSYEEYKPPLRGYDWKRQLGETENVPWGKLRQTLSHLVGAASLRYSPNIESLSGFNFTESEQRRELSFTTTCIRRAPLHIKKDDLYTDRRGLLNTSENANKTDLIMDHHNNDNNDNENNDDSYTIENNNTSSPYICGVLSSEYQDENRRDVYHKRPPQLEAQLRSLEVRLEQQLRSSVGRCPSETTTTAPANTKSNTAVIESTSLSGSVECISSPHILDVPSGGELASISPRESDNVCSLTLEDASLQLNRQTPTMMTTAKEIITTNTNTTNTTTTNTIIPQPQPQQRDRRVDDVFVRHRTEDGASYSLSLTYHDAHGSSRTIDTHPLPPLKFSPRSGVVTPSSTVMTNVSTSRWQTPTPLSSQESGQSSCCPLNTMRYENTKICTTRSNNGNSSSVVVSSRGSSSNSSSSCNRTHLVAPLPLLESTTGPRLQGVAGRRGELRIGAFLGGGWCGKVYECLNTETGEVLAAKQLMFDSKDPKLRHRLKQLELELEVLTMSNRHRMPWIVGFHGTEKRGHSVLMYLEYCARGSLLDYMMSHGIPQPPIVSSTAVSSVVVVSGRSGSGSGGSGTVNNEYVSQQKKEFQQQQEEEEQQQHEGEVKVNKEGDLEKTNVNSSFSQSSSTSKLRVDNKSSEMPVLPLHEIQRFTLQTVEALNFLHVHGYVHLDVKTANILVTENGDARLADFGCSMRLKKPVAPSLSENQTAQHPLNGTDENTTSSNAAFNNNNNNNNNHKNSSSNSNNSTECKEAPAATATTPVPFQILAEDNDITELRGTAVYMAPEMIRFERQRIGTAGDVWSLGCVVMELATGAAPWRHVAKDKLRVLFRMASARENLPLPPIIVHTAEKARQWLSLHMDGATANPSDPAAFTSVHMHSSSSSSSGSSSARDAGRDDDNSNSDDEIGRRGRTITITEAAAAAREEEESEEEKVGEKRRRLESTLDETESEVSLMDPISHDTTTKGELHRRMLLRVALENFLSLCLRVHPEDRPSCEELLRHPFLTIH